MFYLLLSVKGVVYYGTHIKSLKNSVNHLMKERKKEYYSNLILQNHNNSKKVWKCLKYIIPKSADISPHTINVNGANISDSESIAEAFN